MDISVIVPIYNERENLSDLYRRLSSVLRSMKRSFEMIMVDDGSKDGTLAELLRLKKKARNMRVISLSRNFGQHSAVTAGMAKSRGKIVVTLDADLQNPPEEIPKLVAAVEAGHDVAAGWRQHRRTSIFRTLPSQIVNALVSKMTRVKLHDYGCMLRAYRRGMIERYLQCEERTSYITALMSLLGDDVIEVPVRDEPRLHGRSRYGLISLARFTMNLLTGFSGYPIQAVSWLGFVFSILGIGLGVELMVYRIMNGTGGTGLTSFVAVLLFLFGVQFIILGMMGEYLARIYTEVQKRPRYIIRRYYD